MNVAAAEVQEPMPHRVKVVAGAEPWLTDVRRPR